MLKGLLKVIHFNWRGERYSNKESGLECGETLHGISTCGNEATSSDICFSRGG